MAAAQDLLARLKKTEKVVVQHIYLPPLPSTPAPFISIGAAKKMEEDDKIVASAKMLKLQPLPSTYIKPTMPPLPLISYEEYMRQKEANDKLVDFIKSKKPTK